MSELPMRGHFRYLRFKIFPTKPRTPQCEVFFLLLSSSEHSGVPEDSQPLTFPSVGLHPHTWPKWGCDNTSFTNAMQRHFFQIHAIHHGIQLLKACHVEVAKSFMLKHGAFLERICNACRVLTHIHIKKVQVFVVSCLLHNNSSSIVDLTTILVKLHFETFRNEFTH